MSDPRDLLVVGGGVMGLFTAWWASGLGARVTVLERGRIGDPMTASYGRTRSYRSDYLDGDYVRLAREATRLWEEFEARTGTPVLVRCGCMNIAKAEVTPDLGATYAERTRRVLEELGLPPVRFDAGRLAERFPALDADVGYLEEEAGVVDLAAVRTALERTLAERGVQLLEGVETHEVAAAGDGLRALTSAGTIAARTLVVTAGHGTNDVLARVAGSRLVVPLARDRPTEARYVVPPAGTRARFTAAELPVIAYLDTGIYVHPIVEGVVDAVKIGFYNPPDLPRGRAGIAGIDDFVERCMPGLRGAAMRPVDDTDGCDYDLVADDEFVLGRVPGVPNAFVGVGWRGTGYKFAPWVGRVLAQLAVRRGTVYDITRFDPARFARPDQGSTTDDANPAAAAR